MTADTGMKEDGTMIAGQGMIEVRAEMAGMATEEMDTGTATEGTDDRTESGQQIRATHDQR